MDYGAVTVQTALIESVRVAVVMMQLAIRPAHHFIIEAGTAGGRPIWP